jgi:hypothetical protein
VRPIGHLLPFIGVLTANISKDPVSKEPVSKEPVSKEPVHLIKLADGPWPVIEPWALNALKFDSFEGFNQGSARGQQSNHPIPFPRPIDPLLCEDLG